MSGNIRHNGEQIGKGVSPSVICYLHIKRGLCECLHIETMQTQQPVKGSHTLVIDFSLQMSNKNY